jgi:hypothetical protein
VAASQPSRRPADGPDLRRSRVERRHAAAGQEDRRTLAGERPGDRAQRASGSVDHRILTLQEHSGLPPAYQGPPDQTQTAGKLIGRAEPSVMTRGQPA